MTRQHLRISARIGAAVVFSLVALVFANFASAVEDPGDPPPLAGIAHVAIRVHDLDASAKFYKALGFDQPFNLSRNGQLYEASSLSFIRLRLRTLSPVFCTCALRPLT